MDMICYLLQKTCFVQCHEVEAEKKVDPVFDEYVSKKCKELKGLRFTVLTLSQLCTFKIREFMPCKDTEMFESLVIPQLLN